MDYHAQCEYAPETSCMPEDNSVKRYVRISKTGIKNGKNIAQTFGCSHRNRGCGYAACVINNGQERPFILLAEAE